MDFVGRPGRRSEGFAKSSGGNQFIREGCLISGRANGFYCGAFVRPGGGNRFSRGGCVKSNDKNGFSDGGVEKSNVGNRLSVADLGNPALEILFP